jgi:hypothetical protein
VGRKLEILDNLALGDQSGTAPSCDAARLEPPASQFVVQVLGDFDSSANRCDFPAGSMRVPPCSSQTF